MVLLLALVACHRHEPADTQDSRVAMDTGPDGPAPADWCQRIAAPPPDGRPVLVELSAAHAGVRLYGPDSWFRTSDDALGAALRAGTLDAPDLDAYAAAVDSACALDVAGEGLGPASVELRGDVAWITPGTGDVALPTGAKGVVIDLRGLPDDPALDAALAAAVGPALVTPVARPKRRVREWYGFVDQVFSSTNTYKTEVTTVAGGEYAATGAADLPIAVVAGRRMAPAAAELAGTLAEAGRAEIVGQDVLARVAEARVTPVGDRALAWRGLELFAPNDADWWPDVLPADVPTDDPDAALDGVDPTTWTSAGPRTGDADRSAIAGRKPWGEDVTTDADAADLEAGLIATHGTLRAFWRYFDVEGDTIDDRLAEVLADPIDPADRDGYVRRLGRLGEALHDGHVFFGDTLAPAAAGYLPVYLDHLDGEPVIVRSADGDLHPGDTIVAIDGTPIADVYADRLSWHGAATTGYAYDLASRGLYALDAPTTYTLRDPDGAERDVTVDPAGWPDPYPVGYAPCLRASGTLDDLGAPDVAYLNLDAAVTTSTSQVTDLLSAEEGVASGLVVDMRGYPGVNHYTVAQHLLQGDYESAIFTTSLRDGPDVLTDDVDQYEFKGTSPTFGGPIVLLVGPVTVSAAENFSMMLVADPRVTVVGRQSAGTNGNITGMTLPGGFWFTFTGMQVLFPDGSRFHGVGIVPDVEVSPTAADYRDGKDPVLEAAAALLHR